jgi:hypothetical protein
MTKWEMVNLIIDNPHTVWRPVDSRWLMRKKKAELEDMVREMEEADICRENNLY